MNPRRWLQEHSLRLLAIRDTPDAIAGGMAIGIFFAFTPFFGLKEILTMFVAWLTRSNIIAAVLTVTAHNLLLPLMPVIYRWEYDVGYWLLSHPHHWPPALIHAHWEGYKWRSWMTILKIGKPLLLGSVVCSAAAALLTFGLVRTFVARHQLKKQTQPPQVESNELDAKD